MANELPIDPRPRSFNTLSSEVSGLSKNIPLPNIVRIESLNKISRDRYLGTVQRFGNDFRDQVAEKLKKNKLDKFFGFMKGSAPKALELGSTWRTASASGGVMGFLRTLVSGGGAGAGGDLFGLLRDFTGVSASTTGATTLKRFESSTLSGFTVNCGWYLPEQYALCIKSLKSIIAMTYPVQIDELTIDQFFGVLKSSTIAAEGREILNDVTNAGRSVLSKVGDVFNQSASSIISGEDGLTAEGNSDAEQSERNNAIQNKENQQNAEINANINGQLSTNNRIKSDAKKTIDEQNSKISSFNLTKISDFFGRNLTFDPLPVRCSIGQYIDIEPLVITKLGIEFSNDTFINSDGRHLPIFCTVSLTFDFWLNPAPKLQFLSLLGNEMFGASNKGTV